MKNGPYEMIVAPKDWPGRRYRNRYCYEHHYIYWKSYRQLPSRTQCIHHLNGSRRDNRVENLVLIERAEHSKEHTASRGHQVVRLKCPNCQILFEKEKEKTHLTKPGKATFCSKLCAHVFAGFYNNKAISKEFIEQRRKENIIEVYIKLPDSSAGG